MKDNGHATATAAGASSQHHHSTTEKKGEVLHCEYCTAIIPAARNFPPAFSAIGISCIVCGHQNQSSESFAVPSR
jgi:hypothetical protein